MQIIINKEQLREILKEFTCQDCDWPLDDIVDEVESRAKASQIAEPTVDVCQEVTREMAIADLVKENRRLKEIVNSKPPVNDMAGLKAELEALRVFVMSFCDGYSCDHGNDICYCTKPEVKILIKLASILSKYPTAPLPKPSTDSQVEGLREVLKNGLNSCRKLKQDPLQHGGYQYWNGLEQGLLDVADKMGLKCEDCHGSGMVGSGSDGLDYCHCDLEP